MARPAAGAPGRFLRWNHGRKWHGFAVYWNPDRNPVLAYGRAGGMRALHIGRKQIVWGKP